jgi:hypothetical protein
VALHARESLRPRVAENDSIELTTYRPDEPTFPARRHSSSSERLNHILQPGPSCSNGIARSAVSLCSALTERPTYAAARLASSHPSSLAVGLNRASSFGASRSAKASSAGSSSDATIAPARPDESIMLLKIQFPTSQRNFLDTSHLPLKHFTIITSLSPDQCSSETSIYADSPCLESSDIEVFGNFASPTTYTLSAKGKPHNGPTPQTPRTGHRQKGEASAEKRKPPRPLKSLHPCASEVINCLEVRFLGGTL